MKTAILILVLFVTSCAPTTELESNRYSNAIRLGGEWYFNNQNQSFLHYQYNPYENRHGENHHSLREMAALWAITELASFLGDPRYDQLALRGLAHFRKHIAYDATNDFCYINVTPKEVKLSYNAFMILSLLNMDVEQKDYLLEKFANGILILQEPNGSLKTFFNSDKSGAEVDYYPGQALLALMSLYEYNKDQRYLESVKKAYPYYVQYWRGHKNTAFVPWQTRAYGKLYAVTKEPSIVEFIFEMNDYMLSRYRSGENPIEYKFKGITTAVHTEGVNIAYELAVKVGDKERAKEYANFIKEASDYLLTLQVTGQDDGMEKPAIGGFLAEPGSQLMRVDNNQHAVMALMDAYSQGLLK